MTLNCNFKYLKDLDDNTLELYACETIDFTNRAQNEPINYVSNLHEIGRRDRDVKVFMIKHQICHYLPTKIESFFPHIQEIEVDSSELKQLYRENFASLTSLRMAIFPGNDLEFLPGDLFIYNPRLTHIDFSQNKIKTVGKNFFNSLRNLRFLMFDENECYEGYAMVFEEVEVIKEEILSNCSSGMIKSEKRIVVKVEEIKVETKKVQPVEVKKPAINDKQEKHQTKIEVPESAISRSNTQKSSLEIIIICFHLHALATLFRSIRIKF
jgi:hypothetical protein